MARSKSKKAAPAAPVVAEIPAKIEFWPPARITPYDKNPRQISDKAIEKVAASIREFGFQQPIVVDPSGVIIVGHTRLLAAKKLKLGFVPVIVANLSDEKTRAYRIADNRTNQEAEWLEALLVEELSALQMSDFDLALTGFDEKEIDKLLGLGDAGGTAGGAGSLADKFMVPPFSVLNAREGWWQDRKAAWLALGIQSEIGRGENALGFSDTVNATQAGKNPRGRPKKARAKAPEPACA